MCCVTFIHFHSTNLNYASVISYYLIMLLVIEMPFEICVRWKIKIVYQLLAHALDVFLYLFSNNPNIAILLLQMSRSCGIKYSPGRIFFSMFYPVQCLGGALVGRRS